MIVGTLLMRRHGLVLDFGKNILNVQGEAVQTLTAGQEDLLLAKRRACTGFRKTERNKSAHMVL